MQQLKACIPDNVSRANNERVPNRKQEKYQKRTYIFFDEERTYI